MEKESSLEKQIEFLKGFSACDVSDALLKLEKTEGQVPRGGFLSDIVPFAPKSPLAGLLEEQPKVVAPASTVKYVGKREDVASKDSPYSVPSGSHYVDMTEPGTVVVIEQPDGQTCAVLGGIMATRMRLRGAKAIVVGGRVRDLAELRENGLPIWARAKSTTATGAEAKIWGRQTRVTIRGVDVEPGDIIFCDPLEGVVRIPQNLLDDLVSLMPKLVEADDRVKEDVLKGGSVFEAFKKHRGGK